MPRIGPMELTLIVFIILIFFGVGKLPQVGESLGKGIRAFRRASSGEDEKDKDTAKAVESKAVTGEKKEKDTAKAVESKAVTGEKKEKES